MRFRTTSALALALLATAGPALAQAPLFERLRGMLPLELDASSPHASASGDVDGDGDVDLVLVTNQSMLLLLNQGVGSFELVPNGLPAPPGIDAEPFLEDVDGDGDLDLIAVGSTFGLSMLNDGSGSFAPHPVPLPPFAGQGATGALADFDGDGDVDLLVCGPDQLFLNSGAGAFTDAGTSMPATSDPLELLPGDFDRDGDLDVVLTPGSGPPRLFLNDGSGNFVLGADPVPAGIGSVSIADTGDVDGDLDLDLLLASTRAHYLLVNDGFGAFTEVPGAIPPPSFQPNPPFNGSSVALFEDLDGDGDLDVLAQGFTIVGPPSPTRVFLNGGAGTFVELVGAGPAEANELAMSIALDDFDGDADVDAYVVGPDILLLNDGRGRFVDVTRPAIEVGAWHVGVAVGDVDGDGRLDAAIGRENGLRLFVSDGGSDFVDASANLPAGVSAGKLAFGDVDGDGDEDLVTRSYGWTSTQLFLLLNDGTGVFTDASQQIPSPPIEAEDVALGDADGDGDLDLFVAIQGLNSRLYLNDGSGGFTLGFLPLDASLSSHVALGDVDGDGDLDAVWGAQGQNRLHLGLGNGLFVDATAQLPAQGGVTTSLALVDVDGDGDLDLVTGNVWTVPDALALNDGTGTFTDVTATLPSGDLGDVVLAGDFDGDGDVDLYGTLHRLLLNTGSGAFVDASDRLPALDGAYARQGVARDLDGDGDVDLLLSGDPILLTNVTRQIAAREVPRIGKTLTMQVFGAPSVPYVAGVSASTAQVPFPPFGTLGIDLATALFGAGATGPDGRGSLPAPISNNPNLVGVPLYWQALVGLTLTNVEATTFTDL